MKSEKSEGNQPWDHSGHQQFVEDYANKSLDDKTYNRFIGLHEITLRFRDETQTHNLVVADIGCGAGTQSIIWAQRGHKVLGIDINEPLVELAKRRASEYGLNIEYRIGSATELPWANESVDVCLLPELLEHVEDWQSVLDESSRIIRPGGILVLSTNNKLCPKQQEFNLPFYSWYPGFIKRRCEHLARTTKPAIVNYATYPAVNWFSYYGLNDYLAKKGFQCFDRFDAMDHKSKKGFEKLALNAIKTVPLFRFFAHVITPYTLIVCKKSTIHSRES